MKKFLFIISIILPLSIMAEGVSKMHILMADGTITDILLYTRPQVTFEGTEIIVASELETFRFESSNVIRITYDKSATDITTLESNGEILQKEGDILVSCDIPVGRIAVYAIDGRRVEVNIRTSSRHHYISTSALPAGVYVLEVNGKSTKLMKK